MEKAKALDAQRLRDVLDYDSNTGVFTWRVQPSNAAPPVGSVAGHINSKGYRRIGIDGYLHMAHRLVWIYVHGAWPNGQLDHGNGLKDDNRLCNLREVTNAQNTQNQRRPHKDSASGFLGVSWHKQHRKWTAAITIDGVNRYLGLFKTPELAHASYIAAKRQLHPFSTI